MPESPGDLTTGSSEAPELALETAEQTASADESVVLFEREDDTLVISVLGTWSLDRGLPSTSDLERELASAPPPTRVTFDTSELGAWDSALVTFIAKISEVCRSRGITVDRSGLPHGLIRLLELAESVPEKKDAHPGKVRRRVLERIGAVSIGYGDSVGQFLAFLGELSLAFVNMLRGTARFRRSDLILNIQQCGADALGIVALISFLVGVILAFMGAVQLSQIRRSDLRGQPGGDRDGAGHGRDDDRDHHVGPHRRRLRRATGHHEGNPGNRRARHHGHLADGVPGAAAGDCAGPDDAAAVRSMPTSSASWAAPPSEPAMLHLSIRTYLDMTVARGHASPSLIGGLFKAAIYGVLIALRRMLARLPMRQQFLGGR